MSIEWGILVIEPHPRRPEKAGDVIRLGGPDAETKARRCVEFWHGWQPVSRTVRRAGPWTPVADASSIPTPEKGQP